MQTPNSHTDARKDPNAWRAVAAPVIAVALALAMAPSSPVAAAAPDCTLTIDAPIPIGPEQARVVARFSSSIGDSLTLTFPEEANVVVISAQRGRNDGPQTATVVLTTLRATAGQWLATARGEKGVCTGKVWIGQGKPKKRGGS